MVRPVDTRDPEATLGRGEHQIDACCDPLLAVPLARGDTVVGFGGMSPRTRRGSVPSAAAPGPGRYKPMHSLAAATLTLPTFLVSAADRHTPNDAALAATEEDLLHGAVSQQIQPLIDAQVVPGCVVGVWRDGTPRFFGFGGTNADGSGPVPDERTLYEIGSITKVFTAVLLAEMAQRGEVSLDAPIANCYPMDRQVPQTDEDPIVLWHLAAHASGLPGMPTNMPAADVRDPYAGYTLDLMYDFLDDVRPPRAPEIAYEYSNLGSGLLGRLLEVCGGAPWHELLAARIFEASGMSDSVVLVDEATEARVARPSAEGLSASRWGGSDALAPCGAVVSSAADVLRFAAENIEPSEPDSTFARGLAASHEPRFTDPETGQVVALGWHLAGDGVTLWHNGSTGGYSSMLLVNKPARAAVVVLANGAAPSETTVAGDRIMEALLTGHAEPPSIEPTREVAADHLERLVGDYVSPLGFTIHVTREGGKLGARVTGQTRFRVYPEGDADAPTRFRYRVVRAALVFEVPERGTASAVILEQNGMQMRAERRR